MPDDVPTLRKVSYRGSNSFIVNWMEGGRRNEKTFDNEAEAKAHIDALKRKTLGAEPVSEPSSTAATLSTSDLELAMAKLKPIGVDLRTAVQEYAYAVKLLQPYQMSVLDGARALADALFELKGTDVSLSQAIFEYSEARKALGDKPLFDAVRVYKKSLTQPAFAVEAPAPAPVRMRLPEKTTVELVDEFLNTKKAEGLEEEEILDQKTRLKRFQQAFPGPIKAELFFENDAWFDGLPLSGSSKLRLQELVLELGRYAKKKAYL